MIEVSNPARERLKAGQLAIGLGLRQARTVDIAAAMRTCGFDWLFIDLEHNSMTLDTAVQIAVAANGAGISPIVRVPNRQYDMATRALDGGAFGIVMPHVDSAEEAREAVDRLKYPPIGHRSVAGAMPQFAFQPLPLAEAAAAFNANMLLVVMLETPRAIANAEAIAAVPGIDVLLIGTNDLAMEMGLPAQFMHPDVERAYATVIAACRKHGKWAGMGGVYTEAGLAKYIGMGVRMVLSGNDFSFLMAAGGARAKFIRELKL
ncbi:MAG TPA: aldolase/citrate lyase family protein [Candidatus Cybelea sp.]|nr:aldolase/citrate lyase family protein [Candidatus Cybelea sp.]